MALALVIAVIALWQVRTMKEELAALRKTLAFFEGRRSDTQLSARPSAPAFPAPLAVPARVLDADLLALQRRVETLEADLSDAIDSLNKTVDEFNRMSATSKKVAQPGWSAAQASGPPDTQSGGDHPSAWAAAEQDAGPEWLRAQFDTPVDIAQVRVRETDHPGAIVKVTAILDDGREIPIWHGAEPTGLTPPYDAAFSAPSGIKARAVQVELDTRKTPGWEEIDAIELVGRDGSRQWANSVTASSSYGTRSTGLTFKGSGAVFQLLER